MDEPELNDESDSSSSSIACEGQNFGTTEENTEFTEEEQIRFNPPLYLQRYAKVKDLILEHGKGQIKNVADIGCSELGFFPYLRNDEEIEEVILLDLDKQILEDHKHRIQPLPVSYFIKRSQPLSVKLICGNVKSCYHYLINIQAVTMIELIEHIPEEELPDVVTSIFQHLKPFLVVMTTPNADFNAFIPKLTCGKFRHWDHKFEWTTEQFCKWCNDIVEKYPEYQVSFTGVGFGPDNVTYCSQIAVFRRSPELNDLSSLAQIPRRPLLRTTLSSFDAKLISAVNYPCDFRSKNEKDLADALHEAALFRRYLRDYLSRDECFHARDSESVDDIGGCSTQESSCVSDGKKTCQGESSEPLFEVVLRDYFDDIQSLPHKKDSAVIYVITEDKVVFQLLAFHRWTSYRFSSETIKAAFEENSFQTREIGGHEWWLFELFPASRHSGSSSCSSSGFEELRVSIAPLMDDQPDLPEERWESSEEFSFAD